MAALPARYALMEILRAEQVRHVFGNPGSTETPFLDALVAYPDLDYVVGLHESAVVAIADGYARATGRPAVANVHAAPGTANALGSLYNAAMDRSPLVVLAGQQTQALLAQGPSLAADTVDMTRPIVRWGWELTNADELPGIVRRAFTVARRPPRGPTFVSMPKDVLDREVEFDPSRYQPTVEHPLVTPPAEIARAAALLARAQAPAIVAGRGLAADEAWRAVAAIAETLGAPIHASPVGFPAAHPQVCSVLGWDPRPLRRALADNDVVLVAGHFQVLDEPGAPLVAPGAALIHADDASEALDRNAPATVALGGALRATLDALAGAVRDEVGGGNASAERKAATEGTARARREQLAGRLRERWDQAPLAPARVAATLDAVLPADAIVVDEGIRASDYVKWHYRGAVPDRYHSYDGGCLGWGIGMGVGVQLARPSQQVVSVVGDGGATFGIHALWTAARRGLPLVTVVLDNRSYGAIVANLVDYGDRALATATYPGCDLEGIDFVALAGGFGVPARSVTRPDELEGALRWALDASGPTLVHVLTDPRDLGPGHPGRPA
jgi:benzoylformate decarboxylase